MPQTEQEYQQALATLRIRPGTRFEGVRAEFSRINSFLNYLGRPATPVEAHLLTFQPRRSGDVQRFRENLEKLRRKIVAEARSFHAFNAPNQPAGGSVAGSATSGFGPQGAVSSTGASGAGAAGSGAGAGGDGQTFAPIGTAGASTIGSAGWLIVIGVIALWFIFRKRR